MKRKIATLGETDITVHPAAGILLLLGLLTRWRALLICTYASILLHETAHAAVSALWHHLHPTRMTQLYIIEPGTMRLLGVLTEQQLIAAYLSAPQRTLAEVMDA